MARSDTTSEAVRPVPLLERDAVRLWIRRIRLTVSYALLVFFALMFIMPFVLAAISSFKTLPDIAQNPTGLGFDGGLGSPTLDGVERLNRERIRIPR